MHYYVRNTFIMLVIILKIGTKKETRAVEIKVPLQKNIDLCRPHVIGLSSEACLLVRQYQIINAIGLGDLKITNKSTSY